MIKDLCHRSAKAIAEANLDKNQGEIAWIQEKIVAKHIFSCEIWPFQKYNSSLAIL